jgi:hypothetical protein
MRCTGSLTPATDYRKADILRGKEDAIETHKVLGKTKRGIMHIA